MIRRFASKFLILALTKGKQEFLAKQYKLDPQVIEGIAEYDPSPNNAYTAWLCKVYKDEGESLPTLEKLKQPLSKFMKLINSPEFPTEKKDIGKYTAEELLNLVGSDRKFRRQLSQTELERQIMNEGVPGAELIWNANNFKMWHVTNINYAMFLGSNTSWCTAQPHHAKGYCSSGGLYPVYFKNKPFCQGHIDQQRGTISFLNKQDKPMDIDNITFLTFLDVVDLPIVHSFGSYAFNTSYFSKKIVELIEDSEPKAQAMLKHYEKLAIKFKNSRMVSAIINRLSDKNIIWPEGIEFLLDYPSILITSLAAMPHAILKEIGSKYPELTEEIMYEAGKADTYAEAAELIKIMSNLSSDPNFLSNYVDENLGKINLEGNDWPEVISIITKKIKDLDPANTEQNLDNYADFFNNNSYNQYIKDVAFIYWKKFIKAKWPELHDLLEDFPGYKKVIEKQKNRIKDPKVGAIVTTSPEYKGSNEGQTGEILDTEETPFPLYGNEEEGWTVTVKWGNGTEEKLLIVPTVGGYMPLERKLVAVKGWKIDPDQTTPLKVGDMVVANDKYSANPERAGTLAEITLTEKQFDDNFVNVKWVADGLEQQGFFTYRFTRVVESKLSDYPKILKVKDKVKPGPTWTFGNQCGEKRTGVVLEDDRRGWFTTKWDGDSNSYTYRYGLIAGNQVLPFMLDIVPIDIDFKSSRGYDFDNIEEEPEGQQIIELSKTLAEEHRKQ